MVVLVVLEVLHFRLQIMVLLWVVTVVMAVLPVWVVLAVLLMVKVVTAALAETAVRPTAVLVESVEMHLQLQEMVYQKEVTAVLEEMQEKAVPEVRLMEDSTA